MEQSNMSNCHPPMSEDVSHRIPIYLLHPASPIPTAHPRKARIAVTLYVTCRLFAFYWIVKPKVCIPNHIVSLRFATSEICKRVGAWIEVSKRGMRQALVS